MINHLDAIWKYADAHAASHRRSTDRSTCLSWLPAFSTRAPRGSQR